MATEVKVNNLPTAAVVSNADTLMLVQEGISTKQVSVDDLGKQILQVTEVPSFDTENKKPVGAVNELLTKIGDLDYRVSELEKAGTGLNKIKMNLIFTDISEGE